MIPKLDNTMAANGVLEELVRLGLTHAVVCPGSRSTPLAVAIARQPTLHTTVFHDERSAGYFAIGVARATGRPCLVVTTSGTAVANLLPAVVEADRDRVPMLLITADRPFEALGTDANQTIDQFRIFGEKVRRFLPLPPPEELRDPALLWTRIDEAYAQTTHSPAGPVHINMMFRKPLEPLPHIPGEGSRGDDRLAASTRPFCERVTSPTAPRPALPVSLVRAVHDAKYGVIVAGQTLDDEEAQGILALGRVLRWPILADPLASLPDPGDDGVAIVRRGSLLAKSGMWQESPDAVIWTGGVTTSPWLQETLAKTSLRVRIDDLARPDLELPLGGYRVASAPQAFADAIGAQGPCMPSPALPALQAREEAAQRFLVREFARHSEVLDEPMTSWLATGSLRTDETCFVGNSMPIRDLELFGNLNPRHRHRVIANRGASGIDGLISTAAGVAASGHKTLALLGDLSFLHDAGSLSAIAQMHLPLRIVVIENGGGGIFDFLPIAGYPEYLERWFTTPHRVDLTQLCQAYGLPVRRLYTPETFASALDAPIERVEVLIAVCPREANVSSHQRRYAALRATWEATR